MSDEDDDDGDYSEKFDDDDYLLASGFGQRSISLQQVHQTLTNFQQILHIVIIL